MRRSQGRPGRAAGGGAESRREPPRRGRPGWAPERRRSLRGEGRRGRGSSRGGHRHGIKACHPFSLPSLWYRCAASPLPPHPSHSPPCGQYSSAASPLPPHPSPSPPCGQYRSAASPLPPHPSPCGQSSAAAASEAADSSSTCVTRPRDAESATARRRGRMRPPLGPASRGMACRGVRGGARLSVARPSGKREHQISSRASLWSEVSGRYVHATSSPTPSLNGLALPRPHRPTDAPARGSRLGGGAPPTSPPPSHRRPPPAPQRRTLRLLRRAAAS